jgi:hypothetical protein
MKLDVQHWQPLRFDRTLKQFHVSFLGRVATFLSVAGSARAHDILPRRFSATTTRNYVIKSGLFRRELFGTVLTLKIIAR